MNNLLPFPLTHALELRVPLELAPYERLEDMLGASNAELSAKMAQAGIEVADAKPLDESAPIESVTPIQSLESATDDVLKPGADGTLVADPTLSSGTVAAAEAAPAIARSVGADVVSIGPGKDAHGVVFALPLPPSTIEYSDEPAHSLTFTQGAVVLEEGGLRRSRIRVTGTFGQRHKLGTDRDGAPRSWGGERLFAEFIAFLHELWNQHGPGAPKTTPHELIWRDFVDNRHHKVVIRPLVSARDEEHRVFRRYSFEMETYGPAEAVPASWVDAHFGKIRDWTRQAADYIDVANMWVDIARANIEDAANLATDALEPLRALDRLAGSIGDIAAAVGAVKEVGRAAARTALGIRDEVVVGLDRLTTALGLDGDAPALQSAHEAVQQVSDALEATIVALRLARAQSDERVYVVREGDTLEAIAARFYGGRKDAWSGIAAANELAAPYISSSRLPHTAGPGDRIILPAPPTSAAASRDTFPVGDAPSEERVYGVDVADGWPMAASRDDVRLARGLAAVRQNLLTRAATALGSNRTFPGLGLPRLLGQPADAASASVAMAYLTEQLRADDRVDAVVAPAGRADGVTLSLNVTVRLRGDDRSELPIAAVLTGD